MGLIMVLCAIVLMGTRSFAQETSPKTKVPGAPYKQSDYPQLRTGGENIATAVVINALPYVDGGTTCGAVDDYSADCGCCGGSNGAPDLVYSLTPGSNGTIHIDLIGDYDVLVHVRDADGNVLACADDTGFDVTHAIIDLPVISGETYYIVVEGFATICGNYTLTVTGDVTIPSELPLSGWAIGIAIFLIASVALIRYIKLT